MPDPLAISTKFKSEADEIFQQTKLLDVLSAYGTVHIIGSYVLDVMARPDLDIFVTASENDLQKAKAIMHQILDLDYFYEIAFADHVAVQLWSNIRGYYIQPHKLIGDHDWKLDIWLSTDEFFNNKTQEYLTRLEKSDKTAELRAKIIELKLHFRNGEKYRDKINGEKIYKTVLDNPDLSIDQLTRIIQPQSFA